MKDAKKIIFTDWEVQRVLEGKKKQIRKAINPMPFDNKGVYGGEVSGLCHYWTIKDSVLETISKEEEKRWYKFDSGLRQCIYGDVGGYMFVQETWADFCPTWGGAWCGCGSKKMQSEKHFIAYKATNTGIEHNGQTVLHPKEWKLATQMPQWASRIMLQITNIKVERIQEISAEDCYSEGMSVSPDEKPINILGKLRGNYKEHWDSLCKKRKMNRWENNPYVWVISFKTHD